MQTETAIHLWQDGERRLRSSRRSSASGSNGRLDAAVDELRRRLGGAFTTEELVALYGDSGDWVLDVAMATVPNDPEAWDAMTVGGAAFARYVRGASDWSGGRRRTRRELEEQRAAARPVTVQPAPDRLHRCGCFVRGRLSRQRGYSSLSSSSPMRRITIWSSSIVISIGR